MRRATIPSLALLMTTLSAPSACAGQAGPGWRLAGIDLDVVVDTGAAELRVRGTADLTRNGPADMMVLQLGATGRFITAGAAGASPTLSADSQKVTLTWAGGSPSTTTVAFEVVHRERGFQLVVDPRGALASWAEGWYPSPAGAPTRAAGAVRFDLPAGWRVLSNGDETEDAPGVWHSKVPVDWSFAAGPYRVLAVTDPVTRSTSRVYHLEGSADRLAPYGAAIGQVIAALEPRFGSYPYPGYGVVEIPNGLVTWGGSSEQGFFMAPSSALGAQVNMPLLAHELSHGWWGNLVQTTGRATLTLNESLAQYGALRAIEAIEGDAAAIDFRRFSRDGYNSRQSARGFFAIQRLGGDRPLAQVSPQNTHDHNLADAKGHWFYLMLADRLGEEREAALWRSVVRDFSNRSLTLDSLRARIVAAAPDDDGMQAFLNQWLDRPGAPNVAMDWRYAPDGSSIEVTLSQRGAPYHLEMPVVVETSTGRTEHRIALTGSETRALIPLEGRLRSVELDPRHRVFRWTPEYGAPPEN